MNAKRSMNLNPAEPRSAQSALCHFVVPGWSCEPRWRQRLASRRWRRSDDSEPIFPKSDDSGSTARKPNRMSDVALSPLAADSLSASAMISSKSATRWCSWVLTPQTRKSPKGGNRRSKTTGRFLIWPSAWGSGARAMSPSFMGASLRRCIPARSRRRLSPIGRRKIATKRGVRRRVGAPRPPVAHWGQGGRVRQTESSRHQNGLLMQPLSLPVNLPDFSSNRNRGLA